MMLNMNFVRVRVPGVFLMVCALVVVAACGSSSSSPTSPSVDVPYSQTDIRTGSGAEATSGKRVTVNYTLWLYDASKAEQKGMMVQTTVGSSPFSFTLGNGQVIKGWDTGVNGMKVGGLRRLIIPPSLAYGASGNGPIPANATIIFEVELLDVQ
jgi:FKBP-type peptidyl-prolyl cis-trans isomerase FkpA